MKHTSLFFIMSFSLLITACGGGDEPSGEPTNIVGTGGSTGSTGGTTGGGTTVTANKSISLKWDIPTTKVNGDPLSLSEIAGFKIYITTSTNFAPTQANVTILGTTDTDHVIGNLASGKYYIFVTTYDVNGDESPLSDPITKTV